MVITVQWKQKTRHCNTLRLCLINWATDVVRKCKAMWWRSMKDCKDTADEVGQKQKPKHSSDLFLNHCSCSKTLEKCRYQKKHSPKFAQTQFWQTNLFWPHNPVVGIWKNKTLFLVGGWNWDHVPPNFRGANLKNGSKDHNPPCFVDARTYMITLTKNPMEWNGKPYNIKPLFYTCSWCHQKVFFDNWAPVDWFQIDLSRHWSRSQLPGTPWYVT